MAWTKSGVSAAAIGLALAMPLAPAMAAGNLIQNGNFSQLTSGGQPSSSSVELASTSPYIQNGNYLTGWSNSGYAFIFQPGGGVSGTTADTTGAAGFYGTLNLYGPGAGGGSKSNGLTNDPAGQAFVALDSDASHTGAFSQSVVGLTVGQIYTLSFDWAGAEQYYAQGSQAQLSQAAADPNGITQFLTASFSDGTTTQTASTISDHMNDQGFAPWKQASFNFTATAVTETLSFLATGAPSGTPPFTLLSSVSLSAASPVPEPASTAVLAMGLLGVAGFTWSKSRKARRQGSATSA